MSRGGQVVRQWQILRLLEARSAGLRARDLHQSLREVSERTVFRDLAQLQEAGFVFPEENGRWKIKRADAKRSIPVETTELLALMLGASLLQPMRSSEVVEAFERLREKVSAMLTPVERAYAQEVRDGLVATFFAPGDYASRGAEIRQIEDGIQRQHTLKILYQRPGEEPTERKIDPYTLWFAEGRLYLVGWCHLRSDYRIFSIDRLRSIELLDRSFEPDPDFDATRYVRQGFGVWAGDRFDVELYFSPEVAHLTEERRFHPTQVVEPQEDGGALLKMRVAGLPSVCAWVASFGGRVVAQKPERLVQMVAALHRAGLGAHEARVSHEPLTDEVMTLAVSAKDQVGDGPS